MDKFRSTKERKVTEPEMKPKLAQMMAKLQEWCQHPELPTINPSNPLTDGQRRYVEKQEQEALEKYMEKHIHEYRDRMK